MLPNQNAITQANQIFTDLHFATVDDLPYRGLSNVIYHVQQPNSAFVWEDGQYVSKIIVVYNINDTYVGHGLIREGNVVTVDSNRLFTVLKHGDESHQLWLKNAIDAYFAGQPMPEYVAGVSKQLVEPPPGMVLLGWRIDWPPEKGVGNYRWVGADDFERKDRLVELGGEAIELYGDPKKAPSTGPSPWPSIRFDKDQTYLAHLATYGLNETEYASFVTDRGGNGDVGDLRAYLDSKIFR